MKGKLILILLAAFLPLALLSSLFAREPSLIPSITETPMKRVMVGTVPVSVEVADSVAEQTRGLSFRDALAENTGLLFVFEEDGQHGIWMKDMRFPIDVVWADADGAIVHVEHALDPDTYPAVFSSKIPARYVLELPAGFLQLHDLEAGARLTVPLDL